MDCVKDEYCVGDEVCWGGMCIDLNNLFELELELNLMELCMMDFECMVFMMICEGG